MSFSLEIQLTVSGTPLRADADDGITRIWEDIAIDKAWLEMYNPSTKAHDIKVPIFLTPESKTAIIEALEEELVEYLEDQR